MTIPEKVIALGGERGKSYYGARVIAELEYAARLSALNGGRFDRYVDDAADSLLLALRSDGAITDDAAIFAEKLMLPLSEECKKINVHCVAHAHIDMNWMWGYQETAGITVDTFRTVLDLMEEYPDFTYSQSQASVYKIVEEHSPHMLAEIKKRVDEGRWEVAASTWVETDKNMPSGESLARHILNTKRYINGLFGLDADKLELDFEPDTFGHSMNVPEICAAGGVKYYYHCRGQNEHAAYVWEAPSGARLLVYCEPDWYNAEINPGMLAFVPEFTGKYGLTSVLKVYGVGDHGGGPTRRDIERLRDMAGWPLMPSIFFSSYRRFFKEMELCAKGLPVTRGEKNFIFTGCYTTQSRIKMANRVAEDRLNQAEALGAIARQTGGRDMAASFTKAWENVLFNQFHDILPGSGVVDTREYAMGIFQKTLATANTNAAEAMRRIAKCVNTFSIETDDDRQTVSEGAGAGFRLDQGEGFAFPQAERGRGKVRIFTLFNTTPYKREGLADLTLWDWPGDPARIAVKTPSGEDVLAAVTGRGEHYWGHSRTDVALSVSLPPMGYGTYVVFEKPAEFEKFSFVDHGRKHDSFDDAPITLENEHVKAVFSKSTMKLVSLTEKKTNRRLAAEGACAFRLINENPARGMTSWVVGDYSKLTDLNEECEVRVRHVRTGGLRQEVQYSLAFSRSSLTVTVTLDKGAYGLRFKTEVDWHETGSKEAGIPQLSFSVPLGYECKEFANDVPMGVVRRKPLAHDVPCRSFSAALSGAGTCLLLTSDTKYGFRGYDNALSLTLVRAAFDPDPYPEYGRHNINIGVFACSEDAAAQVRLAELFSRPVHAVSTTSHEGYLPVRSSVFEIDGDGVCLSTVKTPEDGKQGYIIRLYSVSEKETVAKLRFSSRVSGAFETDLTETKDREIPFSSGEVSLALAPCAIKTLRVVL